MAKKKVTAEQLEEAITYLADEHGLYLWRVNEVERHDPSLGSADEYEAVTVKGWGFARQHQSVPKMGDTIVEAAAAAIGQIHEKNLNEMKSLKDKIEKTKKVVSSADRFLNAARGDE